MILDLFESQLEPRHLLGISMQSHPPRSGWSYHHSLEHPDDSSQTSYSMSQPPQLGQLAHLAGTKRKLPHDGHYPQETSHFQQPFPQQFSNHVNNSDFDVWTAPNALQHQQFDSTSVQNPHASHWNNSTSNIPYSWSPQRYRNSLPQLSDGSTSVGESPSSQSSGQMESDFRAITMNSWTASYPWAHEFQPHFMGTQENSNDSPQCSNHTAQDTSSFASYLTSSSDLHLQRSMAMNLTSWASSKGQPRLDSSSGLPWDCQAAVPCVDPDCIDGVPCGGPLITPCDKEDCNDGIPCQEAHTSVATEEANKDLDHICAEPCTIDSPEGGFCCNDECPEETRCPSPCFEEDCQVPPCHVERHFHVSPWSFGNVSNYPEQCDCVDPRCMFQAGSSLNSDDLPLPHQTHLDSTDQRLAASLSLTKTHSIESEDSTSSIAPHVQALHKNNGSTAGSYDLQSSLSSDSNKMVDVAEFTCKWVPDGNPTDPAAIICGVPHQTAVDLQDHMNIHINNLERNPESGLFPCFWKDCSQHHGSQGFQARPKLKRHIMTHTGSAPFECDECGRMMRTKDALEKHKRTHSGLKPFKCHVDGCDSCFATTTELKTHLTVHSGKKPHKCPICGEPFADSSNLSKHKKIHEVPKFKCPDCDYKMKRWDQMRRHFLSQKHALWVLESKEAEKQYKSQMDVAFKQLTPEERMLPVGDRETPSHRKRGKDSRCSSTLSISAHGSAFL